MSVELEVVSYRPTPDCYLGVNVPGALFSLGDGHTQQGEGKTCGVAVECAMDAYQLLSQAVESPLANVCDTNYTSLAKVDKRFLPVPSGELVGVHDRLREVGRAYLAER